MKTSALVLLIAVSASGCVESDRNKARGSNDITDDFDQQQWATTSPVGDGSEASGAYYGAPGPSTEPVPERRAASPERAPARSPATPRLGSD